MLLRSVRLSLLTLVSAAGAAMAAQPGEMQIAQAAGAARAVQAGVAGAVRGQVQQATLALPAAVGRNVVSGDAIYLGDRITTAGDAGLQVMLMDQTVFQIGPGAQLTIDEFVYNPDTSTGKVTASIAKGAFRFVTGKIAQREPTAMTVNLPVATIGIRGTIVAGVTDGSSATVILVGPGPDSNTGERVGRVLVSSAGTQVEIARAGFATTIQGVNVPPQTPVRATSAQLNQVNQSLTAQGQRAQANQPAAQSQQPQQQQGQQPQQGQQQQPAQQGAAQPQGQQAAQPQQAQPQQAQAQSAQPQAAPSGATSTVATSGLSAPSAGGTGQATTGLSATSATSVTRTAGQTVGSAGGTLQNVQGLQTVQAVGQTRTTQAAQQEQSVRDGVASFADLRRITTGVANYVSNGVPLTGDGSGSYNFTGQIDFASFTARYQVTGSYTLGGRSGTIERLTDKHDYRTDNSVASTTDPLRATGGPPVGQPGAHTGQIDVSIHNVQGRVGEFARTRVTVTDGIRTIAGGADARRQ